MKIEPYKNCYVFTVEDEILIDLQTFGQGAEEDEFLVSVPWLHYIQLDPNFSNKSDSTIKLVKEITKHLEEQKIETGYVIFRDYE